MKQVKKIIFISILLIISLGTINYAVTSLEETTDLYQKWANLPEEEKSSYIMPSINTLNLEDSVRLSVFDRFTRGVGVSPLVASYDLQNNIEVKIKNQLNTNECWAFSTTTMLETNVAKTKNKNIELSPRHIDYATSKTFLDGTNEKAFNREIGFGNYYISLAYCTSGQGPVLETSMPFENNTNKINLKDIDIKPVLKVENYRSFGNIYKTHQTDGSITYSNGIGNIYTKEQVEGIRQLVKKHIEQYGAVSGYMYIGNDLTSYLNIDKINQKKANSFAYYYDSNSNPYNHAITIIGWDDNYSKENFNDAHKPNEDGAYIVLNSSGLQNNVISIMYVSYEDAYIENDLIGIESTTDIDYDKIYQHDQYGYNGSFELEDLNLDKNATTAYILNEFKRTQSTKEEYLKEVAVYVPTTSNVDIYVNTENNDKTKIRKVASSGILETGYHTVKLSTPLKLTGDSFVISAKFTADEVKIPGEINLLTFMNTSSHYDYVTAENGQSYVSTDGSTWNDLNTIVKNTNVCIKAFTIYQEPQNIPVESITLDKSSIELKKGESTTLIATINPTNAANKNIIWSSNDANIATVSKTGIITALNDGTATITATTEDGNKTATCTVIVKGNIEKPDEPYYNNNQNIKNKPNTSVNQINDVTKATGVIPQTGINNVVVFVIILVVLGTTIIIVKIVKTKDIK